MDKLESLVPRFFRLADRQEELLAEIVAVYRRLEETMRSTSPRYVSALIYQGEKLGLQLEQLLAEEEEVLRQAGELTGREIGSLRQVLPLLTGETRRRLAAKCQAIRKTGALVRNYSRRLRASMEVLATVNRRYRDFFQQVLPINLGYQASGVVASSPAAMRGNGCNRQV